MSAASWIWVLLASGKIPLRACVCVQFCTVSLVQAAAPADVTDTRALIAEFRT